MLAARSEGQTAGRRAHRLTLDNITQRFNDVVAVSDINLDVAGGELVALLGPSGCGKSTLLRIVAGFIRQSEGHVRFDGEAVDHLTPSQRGVGIVFQNYALFPHMSVAQNVAYGLEAQQMGEGQNPPARRGDAGARAHERVRASQAARTSPAASNSASRSRAASRSIPRCCCSTSRSARSTRICASTCRSR